jgi:hypothetical protein
LGDTRDPKEARATRYKKLIKAHRAPRIGLAWATTPNPVGRRLFTSGEVEPQPRNEDYAIGTGHDGQRPRRDRDGESRTWTDHEVMNLGLIARDDITLALIFTAFLAAFYDSFPLHVTKYSLAATRLLNTRVQV